jgi:hypothetical protein
MQVGHINVAIVIDVCVGAIDVVGVLSEAATDDGDIDRVHDAIAIHIRRQSHTGDRR